MGVDYYNCDECGEIYADCNDHRTFEIKGMDTHTVCGYCIDAVRAKLKPAELPDYYFVAKPRLYAKGCERKVFKTAEEMKAFSKTVKENQYYYAVYKSEEFPIELQKSWMGKETGYKSLDEIKDRDFKHRYSSMDIPSTSAAWKNFTFLEEETFYSREKKKIAKYFCGITSEDVLRKMQAFIKEHKLQGKPFMIDEKMNTEQLVYWAFPDSEQHEKQIGAWADTPKDVMEDLESEVNDNDVVLWLPTDEFIQPQIEEIDNKIKKLEKKRKELSKLVEPKSESENSNRKKKKAKSV